MDSKGTIKIADFGQSRQLRFDNERFYQPCGTLGYFAPEITRERGFKGQPIDCWAAGVCLYVLLNGTMPFDPIHLSELYLLQ